MRHISLNWQKNILVSNYRYKRGNAQKGITKIWIKSSNNFIFIQIVSEIETLNLMLKTHYHFNWSERSCTKQRWFTFPIWHFPKAPISSPTALGKWYFSLKDNNHEKLEILFISEEFVIWWCSWGERRNLYVRWAHR